MCATARHPRCPRPRGPARPGWVLALLALLCGPALAAPPPDAGQVQRQAERALDAKPAPPPATEVPGAPEAADAGPGFEVREFRLEGVTLLPQELLQEALEPWRGKPIHFPGLQAALRRIVATYRQHGWFARADLPEQDITDGVVVVQVLEGRFGRLGVLDDGTRANGGFLARMVGRGLHAGEPYALARLERGLLLANDLPGVQVDGVLQPGEEPGTSDLILQVEDAPLLGGSLAIGNDGSRYTGRAQAIGRFTLDNPSGLGDQLGATVMRGEDLEYTGASYTMALGTSGLRGSLGYTSLHYRLGKEFELLEARGSSRLQRAGLSYPLLRSEDANFEMELAWARRLQADGSLGEELRRRRLQDLTLSLFGDAVHRGGRGAHTAWIVDLASGRARLELPGDREFDLASAGVHGRFGLARVELRHDRWINPDWYWRGRLNGQWADGNLDSSQQFVLGGPSGVRGYPVNEAAGDSGAVLQLELHRLFAAPGNSELDVFLFAAGGRIRQRQDPWDDSANNRYDLAAAGLGLRWNVRRFSATLSAGVPVGDNPGGFGGANQDGSRRTTQLWFNLRQRF
ncbi:Polypeptide-transport-associated domain protein ShlB-type [Pseudoxanthomonas suwonensis 11-1]|uniref:Polypeptide-transport-associated domain protein ShlB-type n=1 Tax=Pseudoxanthomonas suwonensis (strain 11-1) TaxID=743721 RepID=E6WR91_PSEUU|nr:Polypeptide-transport-associated domain protein ShlB-type [Pseudoxanthomonas suwonensis 11-1]